MPTSPCFFARCLTGLCGYFVLQVGLSDALMTSLRDGVVCANPWLKLKGELQDHLLADYSSERITDYVFITPNVTQTSFETVYIIANWDAQQGYMVEDHTLAPLGALIRAQGDRLVAGIFTSFNGQPLTNGDHYLIIKQELNQISIHQPMGSDTSLTPPWPSIWQTNVRFRHRR